VQVLPAENVVSKKIIAFICASAVFYSLGWKGKRHGAVCSCGAF